MGELMRMQLTLSNEEMEAAMCEYLARRGYALCKGSVVAALEPYDERAAMAGCVRKPIVRLHATVINQEPK